MLRARPPLAGAGTATSADAAAVYYNPAALGELRRPELNVGLSRAHSRLRVAGQDAPIREPLGVHINVAAPLPLGGVLRDRIAVAAAIYFPPGVHLTEIGNSPEQAFFPLYENRTQRLVIMPGIGARLGGGLSFGAALDLLSSTNGTVQVSDGPSRGLEGEVANELPTRASPIIGLRWSGLGSLTVAATWRAAFEIPIEINSENTVAGVPLELRARSRTLFTPEAFSLGVSYGETTSVTADLTYRRWSRFAGNFVQVEASLPIPIGDLQQLSLAIDPPPVRFEDTLNVRAGVEHHLSFITLRAGAGFEATPVPEQTGLSNLQDSDRFILAGGFGLDLEPSLGLPLSVDASVLAHLLRERSSTKDPAVLVDEDPAAAGLQTSNPGFPVLSGGGSVVTWALQLTWRP